MRTMVRLVAVVTAVAALSATVAITSSDAFGPIRIGVGGVGSISVGIGSNWSNARVSSSDDGMVLCCWTCSKDGQRKCGMKPAGLCARFGEEVSSCSECQ